MAKSQISRLLAQAGTVTMPDTLLTVPASTVRAGTAKMHGLPTGRYCFLQNLNDAGAVKGYHTERAFLTISLDAAQSVCAVSVGLPDFNGMTIKEETAVSRLMNNGDGTVSLTLTFPETFDLEAVSRGLMVRK
jgi:hypothetical protein